LFFAALAFSAFDPPISIDRALSYGSCACFALSLPGIFAATKDNRFSNYLGDLTYPVYLTHTATLSALFWPWAIAGGFGNHLIEISKHISVPVHASLFLLMVVLPIALAVAVVVHHLVERPLRAGFDRILDLARPSLNSAFRPVTVFVNRSMRRPLD
jgi:peptidoglycan/LPS O-acetylase OafA/YrhL